MRKISLTLLLVAAVCAVSYAQRKAVFIIVDGIPADVVEKLDMPVLDEIAKAGGYTRAYLGGAKDGYSESPTISGRGLTTMFLPGYGRTSTMFGITTLSHPTIITGTSSV